MISTGKKLMIQFVFVSIAVFFIIYSSPTETVPNDITAEKVPKVVEKKEKIEGKIDSKQEEKTEIDSSLSNEKVNRFLSFETKPISNTSKASYDISLAMNEEGLIEVEALIYVENLSNKAWNEVVFYFIPNAFTEANLEKVREVISWLEDSSELNLEEIRIDEQLASYFIEFDTLQVILDEPLKPSNSKEIKVKYNFTPPENGVRLADIDNSYFLAQWYPMLATYRDGWNKEDYNPISESYHTDHSDFDISYKVPKGYTFVSSALENKGVSRTSGKVKADNVKEVFAAILKEPELTEMEIDGVEIRIFGNKELEFEEVDKIQNVVKDAFTFYHQKIGSYPYKQLDIIVGGGVSMEYPGVVTVRPDEHVIAHEIAHQWFYATVSNDPYYHGWIDEGLAEVMTSLYKNSNGLLTLEDSFNIDKRMQYVDSKEKNASNLPISELGIGMKAYLYDQPAIKLFELFEDYGGAEAGIQFLHHFYHTYSFEEVDTEEFQRFTKHYFKLDGDYYFKEWLR